RLSLGIDPVQVLEDQEQRPLLALPQQQALAGFQCALPALGRIEGLPRRVLDGHVEQGEQSRQCRLQSTVEGEQLTRDPLAHRASVSAGLDAEVRLEQLDDGQITRRLAVRDGSALQDQPALRPVGVAELPDEARLTDAWLADERDDLAVARARLP